MIVILAEKPSQANAYADAFKNTKKGDGFIQIPPCNTFPTGATLTWGIGHLVTLKEPHDYKEEWRKWDLKLLPLIPSTFQFKVSEATQKQFNVVRDLIKKATLIIVATDCDREGENIARSIIELSGGQHIPTKRLWINSLVESEVLKGFQNLKDGNDYYSLYEEAQARQISDWVVGLNCSRLYTLLLQQKGLKEVFPVGRVISPTLKMIYDRQIEIANFKSTPFFELEATFKTQSNNEYKGKYKDRFQSKQELSNFLQAHSINSVHTSLVGEITEVTTAKKQNNPPKLHSLSSLQSLTNKKYKLSPSKVLSVVQSLYDAPLKLVTYPRTDTQYITINEFQYLKQMIGNYQKIVGVEFQPYSLEPNKDYVNNEKVQEHYAIIPTEKVPTDKTLNSLSEEQKIIYFEILKSALAIFHSPYFYEETTLETVVNNIPFQSKGKVELSKGWKELFSKDPKEETNKEEDPVLPVVNKGMKCSSDLITKEGKTKPPKPYTEGQLINLMKHCGKFVEDEEQKKLLNNIEGIGTEATRSSIIESLKKQQYIEIKKNIVHVTKKGEILCTVINGTMLAQPEMTAKWESYLKKIGKKQGSKDIFVNKTIEFTKQIVENITKRVTATDLKKDVEELKTVEHVAKCPSCKDGYITDRKTFYGCTGYKEGCKQSFNKEFRGKKVTATNVKQLCEKGKTTKIKGFKKKESKDTYEGYLVLESGNVKFSFK